MFTVKQGAHIWPADMFEPLVMSLTSPLLNHRPWSMRRSKWVAARQGEVSDMFQGCASAGGSYLCKFWTRALSGKIDVL